MRERPFTTLAEEVLREKRLQPSAKWPMWAIAIAKLKSDQDKGVGDTVERLLGKFGKSYQTALIAVGVPCGCDRRRTDWNARYPFT